MTLPRPCLDCGRPVDRTRCPDCERAHRGTRHDRGYDAPWDRLSKRARKLQPFCIDCFATEDLTADHIIPKHERPDLRLVIENVAVRCRPCNGRKAGRPPTDQERAEVEARIAARRRRRRVASV